MPKNPSCGVKAINEKRASSSTYLKICHLSKTYDLSQKKALALQNISLELQREDFLVILGPSGSGKSTLLNIIAGLESPTTGSIELMHDDFTKIPPHQRNLGMVFQTPVLYPHLTIYENLAYPLQNKKISKQVIQEKITSISELFGIGEFLQHMPHQLSGGQRQRISIAKALIKNPHICLFDEPLSALDTQLRSQMIEEIKKIHQKLRFTAIYVTHDHQEATRLATQIAIFDHGNCLQVATPEALHNAPKTLFSANFFGFSPMFFLDARYEEQVLKIAGIEEKNPLTIPQSPQQMPLVFAIRSEYILVEKPKEHVLILAISIQKIEHLGLLSKIYTQIQGQDTVLTLSTNMIQPYVHLPCLTLYLPVSKSLIYQKENGLLLGYFSDFCYHDR